MQSCCWKTSDNPVELIITTLNIETRGYLCLQRLASRRPRSFGGARRLSTWWCRAIRFSTLARAVRADQPPHRVLLASRQAHRTCDRISAVARFLEELAAAGVEQVIGVRTQSVGPHQLKPTRLASFARVRAPLSSGDTAIRDSVSLQKKTFRGFLISRCWLYRPAGLLTIRRRSDELDLVSWWMGL
jgi:hypothetical protein